MSFQITGPGPHKERDGGKARIDCVSDGHAFGFDSDGNPGALNERGREFMQITIQGSGRRVKLTATERGKIATTRDILRELSHIDKDAAAAVEALCSVLGRIGSDGLYRQPETTDAAK